MPKVMWENFKPLVSVRKTDKTKIVVAIAARDGVRYISLREFYLRVTDQVWRPSRDGMVIPLYMPIEEGTKVIQPFNTLIKALQQAAEEAETMELYDEKRIVFSYSKEEKEAMKNAKAQSKDTQ